MPPPIPPQGGQSLEVEKPTKVYAEQYRVGQPLPIGARTDAPNDVVVPPYVITGTGVYYRLNDTDWILSHRYTGRIIDVIGHDEFVDRFGPGGNQ
jgi:hypothetical protein